MSRILQVHTALFIVALIYSINYVIAKFITPSYILPFGIVLMRVWGAAFLFLIIHHFFIKEKIRSRSDYIQLMLCSVFGVILNQLLFFKGLSITSSINTSIIMTTSPILILIISALLLGERITKMKLSGIFLGALGAFLLIGGSNFSFQSDTVWGDIFILLNACSYGLYLVLVKPLMRKYHSLTVVKWIFTFGCVGVGPFAWREFMMIDWGAMPIYAYFILIYIIIGVTFLAYLLNAWGLTYVNASVVGFYIYLQPVITSLIAINLGQDNLTFAKICYTLMIFTGVYLVSRPEPLPTSRFSNL